MNDTTVSARQEWRASWTLVLAASVGFSFFSVMLGAIGLYIDIFSKEFDWSRRVPFAVLLLIPLGFVVVGSSPPEMLFGMFGLYGLSGPLAWAWRRLVRWRRPAPQGGGSRPG